MYKGVWWGKIVQIVQIVRGIKTARTTRTKNTISAILRRFGRRALNLRRSPSRRSPDELVTGLRTKSLRCNEQEVERLLSWLIGNADIEEELATVTVTNGRVCRLTEAARRRVGLSVEKEKISVVLERSDH